MQVEIKDNTVVITLPFDKDGRDSKSGKTKVHASTNGNRPCGVKLPNGKELVVGVNAYTDK